jgi:crotonobetainyl-CoA:carnitine CoA-transferase CaiB-like acyl-CoA transferase
MSVTLDLKAAGAVEVFADLVRHCDVVVSNFSPGTSKRLGVDFEHVHAIEPRVVYCAISGFGTQGGKGRERAFDAIIQAMSGLMMTSGTAGAPPVNVGFPIADTIAPLYATIGILAALNQARRTGVGQLLDVSMLGTLTALVACESFAARRQAGIPERTGNTVPRLAPFGVYQTCDSYVAICAGNDRLFSWLADEMGEPALAEDGNFKTRDARARGWAEVDRVVSEWVSSQRTADVVERLETAGIPVAAVRGPVEAAVDPEVVRRHETEALHHPDYPDAGGGLLRAPGIPIVFSGAERSLDRPAPALGQHNDEVFGDLLGYDQARRKRLRAAGVIGE